MMRIFPVGVALSCLLACQPGGVDDGSESGDEGVGEGCETHFADKGSFFCGASFQAQCDVREMTPDVEVEWLVGWVEDPPTQAQLDCVQQWLDANDLAGPASDGLYFPVTASYDEVAALCRAQMIGVCEPGAVEGACDGLDEQACDANPLCGPILGRRIDADSMCLEAAGFTACMAANQACPGVEAMAEHEDGSCWLFSGGCTPGAPWGPVSDACPDGGAAGEYPECG